MFNKSAEFTICSEFLNFVCCYNSLWCFDIDSNVPGRVSDFESTQIFSQGL